jgi:hypothetical protein
VIAMAIPPGSDLLLIARGAVPIYFTITDLL